MMKVVIFGTGALADLVSYYLQQQEGHELAGFTVDSGHLDSDTHDGYPLVPFEEVETRFPPDSYGMFISMGYSQVNHTRQAVFDAARSKGYAFHTCASPSAGLRSESMGQNCFVGDGAMLNPFSRIGDGVFVMSGAVVSHHVEIGDFCYLSPSSTILGQAKIGARCFVGGGCVVRNGLTIAADTILGLGSMVLSDIDTPGVYVGSPAQLKSPVSDRTKI